MWVSFMGVFYAAQHVAVAARADAEVTAPATISVDIRGGSTARAGALAWESPDVVTGWHHHPYHQLEYALSGIAEVETERGRYLLPPRQAIWIPAGIAHDTTLRGVSSVSVFFHPDDYESGVEHAAILAVPSILREMIQCAQRWPIDRPDVDDPIAAGFFRALALLIAERVDDALPLWLPSINDSLVADVIDLAASGSSTLSLERACAVVGISQRTLRRRIRADIDMSWSEYVLHANLMRAMALLAGSDCSVIEISSRCGFDSPSGFVRAFRKLTGTTPSTYRSDRRPLVGRRHGT
jgi:AraC-like DNA-binding protein/quercetin dioxygenase-like cupin family protein